MNETKITNSSVPLLRLVTNRIVDILVFYSSWSVTLFTGNLQRSGKLISLVFFSRRLGVVVFNTVCFRFATTVP